MSLSNSIYCPALGTRIELITAEEYNRRDELEAMRDNFFRGTGPRLTEKETREYVSLWAKIRATHKVMRGEDPI